MARVSAADYVRHSAFDVCVIYLIASLRVSNPKIVVSSVREKGPVNRLYLLYARRSHLYRQAMDQANDLKVCMPLILPKLS